MKALITITTCEGRETSYLDRTLASLSRKDSRGTDDVEWLILSDGGSVGRYQTAKGLPWNVLPVTPAVNGENTPPTGKSTPPTGGCVAPLWRAFSLAREHSAERLIYFEDDIIACADWLPYMLSLDFGEHAFIDFCDFKERPETDHGIFPAPVMGKDNKGYHGTQAMMFPLRTCRWLAIQGSEVDSRQLRDWRTCLDVTDKMCDMVLGSKLAESPWPTYGVHIPCLCEHVGATSLLGDDKLRAGRVATNFLGESWSPIVNGD